MSWTMLARVAASVLLLPGVGAGLVGGCGALDVSDPTRIEDEDLTNATAADLLRKDALTALAVAVGEGAGSSGMLADEFFADPGPSFTQAGTMWIEETLDRRLSRQYEEGMAGPASPYASWQAVRLGTMAAIPHLRAYMPDPPRSAYLGQMFAVRGFAALHLAETVCPGFPLNSVVDYKFVHGPPLTTAAVFEQALADFDSAVVHATDTTRFLHLAQVGRARTLLGLDRFEEAAVAAASLPTDYVWITEFSISTRPTNPLWFTLTDRNNRRSVADSEGGTGLDFISANDPRVRTTLLGPAFDGVTEIWAIEKYLDLSAPIVLASGIEARLIEAEAALRAGNHSWLAMLNDLRATQVTPPLGPLADPGTLEAQVDLLFRERAFWLFATGHRLGDLRRLIASYGRSPENVFPSGTYRLGGSYDEGTSIPFPAEREAADNPAITGCTNR